MHELVEEGGEGGRDPRVDGSQTPPSLAHTRDEVWSSSSSVVSCHAVSIHSDVVIVCICSMSSSCVYVWRV
jgi:hypothetical protein